jgi:hypothetical protein
MERGEYPLKEGLIEKRSDFLKQWRSRWLVLTPRHVYTFKNQFISEAPTLKLALSDVLEVIPAERNFSKTHSFRIVTQASTFYFASDPEDVGEWMASIGQAAREAKGTRAVHSFAENCMHSRKANSDEHLIRKFNLIKRILVEREADLLGELEGLYTTQKSKCEAELETLTKSHASMEKSYQAFREIYEDNAPLIMKTQRLKQLEKLNVDYGLFDALKDAQLRSNIEDSQLSRSIHYNFKVIRVDPNERRIRRTPITRALKWRYTGERLDCLSFSVNQDVYLTGVGLCGPHKEGRCTFVKDFQVLQGATTKSTSIYRQELWVYLNYDADDSVVKISLDSPVHIRRDAKYTVYFKVDGDSTYKCVDCQESVTNPDGISFNFSNTTFVAGDLNNRSDVVCGPIADFYYIPKG